MSDNSNIEELLEEAWDQRRLENYEKARGLVRRATALAQDDDYNSHGRILHICAQFESDHDDYSKALELYKRSLENYKKAGNSDKIAHSTRHIADILRTLGNDADAESHYREAINIYMTDPKTNAGDLANSLAGFALILEKSGRISQAVTAWNEIKELYRVCGIKSGVVMAQQKLQSLKP